MQVPSRRVAASVYWVGSQFITNLEIKIKQFHNLDQSSLLRQYQRRERERAIDWDWAWTSMGQRAQNAD